MRLTWKELNDIADEEFAHNALEQLTVGEFYEMKDEKQLREWLRDNRSEYDWQNKIDDMAEERAALGYT